MSNRFSAYFALEKRLRKQGFDVERTELVGQYTNSRKSGLTQLTHTEYIAFLTWIRTRFNLHSNDDWQQSPSNRMRRKVYKLFVQQMKYSKVQFEAWMLNRSVCKKSMQQYTHNELVKLVTQAEKVYQNYLKGLEKKGPSMPYGKYKGDLLDTVPDSYLNYIYERHERNDRNKAMWDYLDENIDAIRKNLGIDECEEY